MKFNLHPRIATDGAHGACLFEGPDKAAYLMIASISIFRRANWEEVQGRVCFVASDTQRADWNVRTSESSHKLWCY
jgi:hypothetical protein